MRTTQKLLFILFLSSFILSLFIKGNEGASSGGHHHHHHHHGRQKKLFVFGDSYADTGNSGHMTSPWKPPYGVTFPGKPSGRYSDGRVSTDFLARFLGNRSPLPYRWMKYVPEIFMKYGINFAIGGTGVFDTPAPYSNMTSQIDSFEALVHRNVFTKPDLHNSVALVSVAGNDYSAYLSAGGSLQGLEAFVRQVVSQLIVNLQRIYKIGVRKIAVAGLQPLGCLPTSTVVNQFQECNATSNQAVMLHNLLLQQGVAKLNNQSHHQQQPIIILDLYNAFLSVLQKKHNNAQQGSLRFENLMTPCCVGVNQTYNCGSLDKKGNKMFKLCKNPKTFFFWDTVHPTDAGWKAIYFALQTNLQQLQF